MSAPRNWKYELCVWEQKHGHHCRLSLTAKQVDVLLAMVPEKIEEIKAKTKKPLGPQLVELNSEAHLVFSPM